MDERDKNLLQHFDSMLKTRFDAFTDAFITPLSKEILLWKEENEQLKSQVNSCVQRIDFLEKCIRDSNLIFTNVPSTNSLEQSVKDICKGQLKIEGNIEIEKVIPIKRNNEKNTVTILTTFGSKKTTEMVLKQAKNLKGTNIGVDRDFSKEVREARNILLLLRRRILSTGSKVNIKVFGNVIIIGNEKLKLLSNSFGNNKIDGVSYVAENFNINFNDLVQEVNPQ